MTPTRPDALKILRWGLLHSPASLLVTNFGVFGSSSLSLVLSVASSWEIPSFGSPPNCCKTRAFNQTSSAMAISSDLPDFIMTAKALGLREYSISVTEMLRIADPDPTVSINAGLWRHYRLTIRRKILILWRVWMTERCKTHKDWPVWILRYMLHLHVDSG